MNLFRNGKIFRSLPLLEQRFLNNSPPNVCLPHDQVHCRFNSHVSSTYCFQSRYAGCCRLFPTNHVLSVTQLNQKPAHFGSWYDQRYFSTSSDSKPNEDNGPDSSSKEQLDEKRSSLVQRFKTAYLIYGKVVILVHGATSLLWFSSLYLLAKSGVNVLDLLEAANAPSWITSPLKMGGGAVGVIATTLVLYKIVAPLRYGLTLLLTKYGVQFLRSKGKAPTLANEDRLRNLAREGARLSRERFNARIVRSRRGYKLRRFLHARQKEEPK